MSQYDYTLYTVVGAVTTIDIYKHQTVGHDSGPQNTERNLKIGIFREYSRGKQIEPTPLGRGPTPSIVPGDPRQLTTRYNGPKPIPGG